MITSSQCFTLLFHIPVYQCKPGSCFFSFFWSSLPGVSEECNSLVTISQRGQNFLNFLQLQSHLTAVNKERSLLLCLPGRVFHSVILWCLSIPISFPFCKFDTVFVCLFVFFYLISFIRELQKEMGIASFCLYQSNLRCVRGRALQRAVPGDLWQQSGIGVGAWGCGLCFPLDPGVIWSVSYPGEVHCKSQQ